MDKEENIIEQREALLDGINFICSKLEKAYDNKRSNFFIIAQLLVTLALPQGKKSEEVNVEDLFNATDMVLGVLDSMVLKQKSKIN